MNPVIMEEGQQGLEHQLFRQPSGAWKGNECASNGSESQDIAN